jgi:hypothetical protein
VILAQRRDASKGEPWIFLLPGVRRPGTILASVVSSLLLTIAACGTNDSQPHVATVATSGASPTAAASADVVTAYVESVREYVACLRDKGVDVSDPDTKGRIEFRAGTSNLKADPKFTGAQQKCKNLLPPVPAGLEDKPVLTAKEIQTKQRYAACMRQNGAPDFPDPGPDGYYPERSDGSPVWNQEAAGAQRAGRACASIIGAPTSPGTGVG